ncbi:MAG: type II toxin-antitoxin system PemK/MazF family toxin [Methylobacter sp.]|nr:type II toxin-antitoxin system PemK/MazF family toxin [Methylobacter sp.]
MAKEQQYIPDRRDIVWLDFEPQKGKEAGKYRPALILSSKAYAKQTGLVICCPISSSIRGTLSEVPVSGLDKTSVVASSIVQTLSWRERKVKFILTADKGCFTAVLQRLLPLLGLNELS